MKKTNVQYSVITTYAYNTFDIKIKNTKFTVRFNFNFALQDDKTYKIDSLKFKIEFINDLYNSLSISEINEYFNIDIISELNKYSAQCTNKFLLNKATITDFDLSVIITHTLDILTVMHGYTTNCIVEDYVICDVVENNVITKFIHEISEVSSEKFKVLLDIHNRLYNTNYTIKDLSLNVVKETVYINDKSNIIYDMFVDAMKEIKDEHENKAEVCVC